MSFGPAELGELCAIARSAGEAILSVYASDFAVALKPDDSPLTQADLRAEMAIQAGLARFMPGVPVWSEESPKPQDGTAAFFLVDPLDGTKEFVRRSPEFTVNIALIEHRRPVAGVVLAPALGEIFFAAAGEGTWHSVGHAPPQRLAAPPPAPPVLRVLGSRSHGLEETARWLDRLPRPHQMLQIGSSLKFGRIAQGQADLYARMGPTSQWDTAAGHAVLATAGGAVRAMDGAELLYGLDRDVINPSFVAVGDPRLLAELPDMTG